MGKPSLPIHRHDWPFPAFLRPVFLSSSDEDGPRIYLTYLFDYGMCRLEVA